MSDATVSARVRGARRCSRTGWLHGTPVPQWSWSIPRSDETRNMTRSCVACDMVQSVTYTGQTTRIYPNPDTSRAMEELKKKRTTQHSRANDEVQRHAADDTADARRTSYIERDPHQTHQRKAMRLVCTYRLA